MSLRVGGTGACLFIHACFSQLIVLRLRRRRISEHCCYCLDRGEESVLQFSFLSRFMLLVYIFTRYCLVKSVFSVIEEAKSKTSSSVCNLAQDKLLE